MNTKQKLAAVVAVALGSIAAIPAYAASTTHTLNLSATINGSCRFNDAGPTALTIANSGAVIDQSVAVDATGSANVTFRCTTGTSSAVSAGAGLHASGGSNRVCVGADCMPYTLGFGGTDVQVGSGHGVAGDKTLAVTATIVQANFVAAPAGNYTDSVILTITP